MIQVQDIINEFGQYYVNEGQNMNRLKAALTQGSETLAVPGIRHIQTDETVYRAANVMGTETVQAYAHQFDPKGEQSFTPNAIELSHLKVDQLWAPDTIEDNWLGFLAANNCHPKDWPVVRYLMEEVLAKQIDQDRELRMVYLGNPDDTTLPANDAARSMRGIRSLLNLLSTAAYPITPVSAIGDLDYAQPQDVFDKIEAFAQGLPGYLQTAPMTYFVAPEVAMAYLRAKRANGFYQIEEAKEIRATVDFTRHEVRGVASMTGTKDFWATPAQNIVHLTKKTWRPGAFDVQAHDRDVKVLGDWYEGIGFIDNRQVFATDETIARGATTNSGNGNG